MNRIIVLFFLFLAIGCNDGNDVPDGMLTPHKMQHVMWDMIQVDGLVSYTNDSLIKKPEKRIELYHTVLSNHKLSREKFRKSMKYYQTRPDLLKIVFDSLQQMALRDTVSVKINKPQAVDTSKVLKDTVKSQSDTIRSKLDTSKRKRLPIERIKALQRIKPV